MRRTWIDLQPADAVDAAIIQVRVEDPEAWALFDGKSAPRYALWAYLALGHAANLPFPAAMDVIEALRGEAGFNAYTAGMSPHAATSTLTADEARLTSSDGDLPALEALAETPAVGPGR